MEVTPNINRWLAHGERGISSETIVGHLAGIAIAGAAHGGAPIDPSDLRRCVLLLDAAPELRTEFYRMAEISTTWALLVENWQALTDMLKREAASNRGRCPETYKWMQQLAAQARKGN